MGNRQALLTIGESFEFVIMTIIRSRFPDSIILHDVHLYSHYLEAITQIDIIAICDNGVFVIEAKNWHHWIKGNYGDFKWSGLTNNRKIIEVFNPYHQNFIHVRELKNAIRTAGKQPPDFQNLVVVPDGTAIQSDCLEVVQLNKLWQIMQSVSHNCDLSKKEIAEQICSVTSINYGI